MSFDRFKVQTAIELELGCTDLSKWKDYKRNFKQLVITNNLKDKLLLELKADACDLYFKAIFSIADAISNLAEGRHSWSVVKLYYAVFYLLRVSMATEGLAFVKNYGIYTIKLDVGEKPVQRDKGKYKGKNITGDHTTTIATYVSLHNSNDIFDILQTNTIDGVLVYDWMMNAREQVHYRERTFQEPNHKYFYDKLFNKNEIKQQVEIYINDTVPIYCFDKDHCCLSAPLKLALLTRDKLANFVDFEPFDGTRKHEIERLLTGCGLNMSSDFIPIYDFGRD